MSDEWLIRNPDPDALAEANSAGVEAEGPLPPLPDEDSGPNPPSVSPLDANPPLVAEAGPDAEPEPEPGLASHAAPSPSGCPEDAHLQAEQPSPGPRCPYCREALHEVVAGHQDEERAAERTVACAECQTPVHARCVQIHGGCVTNGCSGRSFAFVDSVPRPQIRAARIARPRARRRARAREPREPRQVPECPRDWLRRDAPLLVLGLVGILSLALFGDSLAEGARHLGELHAAVTDK